MTQPPEPTDTPGDARRNAEANQQWGGRFAAGPSVVMQEINASIGCSTSDCGARASKAPRRTRRMLAKMGVITAEDAHAIHGGLEAIAHEIATGAFPFSEALEDIRMNIEARLADRIGEAGKRRRTGRSRSDQVATDFPPLGARGDRAAWPPSSPT